MTHDGQAQTAGQSDAGSAAARLELNAAENIWQCLRQAYLSNRVFPIYAAIIYACQDTWRKLFAETGRIASILTRKWAAIVKHYEGWHKTFILRGARALHCASQRTPVSELTARRRR